MVEESVRPVDGQIRRMDALPEVDPATVGISFVDILFALAAGVVLAPVQSWASDTAKNHLSFSGGFEPNRRPDSNTLQLHRLSQQHEPAKIQDSFHQYQLRQVFLDISMVVVYFILAGFAAQSPPSARAVSLLVLVAFGLYLLWDLAGCLYESSDSRYEAAWNTAKNDPDRPDVSASQEWPGMDRKPLFLRCSG